MGAADKEKELHLQATFCAVSGSVFISVRTLRTVVPIFQVSKMRLGVT